MTALQCATTLVLARHGEAEYEVDGWTADGGSLTSLGRRQATDLGERMARRRVAHLWASPWARAVQTAEIAAARLGVSVTIRNGLHEFTPGDFEGTSTDVDVFASTYGPWRSGDLEPRIPGGESGHEIVARVRAVLSEIADAHPGETVLVVAHGGVLRVAVPALCQMRVEPSELENTATVEVLADADAWVCTSWG